MSQIRLMTMKSDAGSHWEQISEMTALARNEQACIKRKMRPIVRIFKQSQSKH